MLDLNLIRRCVVDDDLNVQYYLDPTDSTKKADGTASVLDGTDGQVMVQIPQVRFHHFYKNNVHVNVASFSKIGSYTLHPAFIKDGEEVQYRYIGAYEGYITGGKLCSISGVLPTVYQTRAQFRAAAAARGSKWRQQDFYLSSLIQLLMVVQYGHFNMQSAIGAGLTTYPEWSDGPQALTGNSNAIGNATGYVASTPTKWAESTSYSLNQLVIPLAAQNGYTYKCTSAGTSDVTEPTWPTVIGNTVVDGGVTWQCVRITGYLNWCGIENFFGHIWKFVDGINIIADRKPYVCNIAANFADNTTTNYEYLGVVLPSSNGYQQTLCNLHGIFLPASVGSDYIGDYYYQDTGNRVALLGGSLRNGSKAGACYWYLAIGSAYSSLSVGGRLCA